MVLERTEAPAHLLHHSLDSIVSSNDRLVQAWSSLPRRIYLDTGTMQALFDYGDVIWESDQFIPTGRAAKVAGFAEELEALRLIFSVNERAQFELVVTEASLREVMARGQHGYTQWVHDVLDTWLIQSVSEEPPSSTESFERPGSVSVKDWRLLQDALALGCDAFLTMERRLATQADVIERATHLRVMRPSAYWNLFAPWARLYL